MTETRLHLAHSGRGLHVANYGTVCVALWQTKPTRPLFDIQRQQLAEAVKRHPHTATFLCIVQPSADPPDQEIRNASTEMIAAHGANLAAVACIIEGSGFRAAITRTVLTGIMLVLKNPCPFRFLEDVKTGADWLSRYGGHERAAGLTEALAEFRRNLETNRARPSHAP